MFDLDICICANSEYCPKKDTCLRATYMPRGIYTASNFYGINDKECEYYINTMRNEEEE